MRYLVMNDKPPFEPFLTNWFDTENNFNPGMIVYDLMRYVYTLDGKTWIEIPEDHL